MWLFLASVLGCTGSECGEGTHPEGDQCVLDEEEGGDTSIVTDCGEDDEEPTCDDPDNEPLEGYAPVVVATVPQAGCELVDPGLTEIRVTFSRDMLDGNWSWVQYSDRTFPEISEVWFEDDRTNVAEVVLEPDHTYRIGLNADPYLSFTSADGETAVPFELAFHTAPE